MVLTRLKLLIHHQNSVEVIGGKLPGNYKNNFLPGGLHVSVTSTVEFRISVTL